jgi:hypothetical protein
MGKILSFVFGFEIAAMIVAYLSFQMIADRGLASVVAGSMFVALGVTILTLGMRDRAFRKTFTFWLGLIHLFVISLPMMGTRIATFGADFQSVLILGMIPGPTFHKLSEMFYIVLVIGTVIDRVMFRAEQRRLGIK